MEELKQYVSEKSHIQVVYFDAHGNWFLHKGRTIVSEKTRAEILGSPKVEVKEPTRETHKSNKKK